MPSIVETDVPIPVDKTESNKSTDSSVLSAPEHAQKEIQDSQKTKAFSDLLRSGYGNWSVDPFLPDVTFTNKESQNTNAEQPKSLSELVRANEAVFDTDNDGEISRKELAKAAANPSLDKNVAAAVVALTKNYEALADLNFESIIFSKSLTVKDIDEFCKMANNPDKSNSQKDLMNSVDAAMKQTINQTDNLNHDVYGRNNEISPRAVQQGGIGDCSFLAVLTSMASTESGRESIRSMIKTDGDGYIVNFPGGESTRVEKPTAAELTLYAGNNGNGIWPAVLEKAYGKVLSEKHNKDVDAPQLAADGCEKYGPLNTLTGEKRCVQSIEPSKMDDERLHNELIAISRNAMLMTAGTGPNVDAMVQAGLTPTAERVDANGNPIENSEPAQISGFHVYAIEKYDPATKSVFLRNPHDGTQLLKMPLSTYRQAFVAMSSVPAETYTDRPTFNDEGKPGMEKPVKVA